LSGATSSETEISSSDAAVEVADGEGVERGLAEGAATATPVAIPKIEHTLSVPAAANRRNANVMGQSLPTHWQ